MDTPLIEAVGDVDSLIAHLDRRILELRHREEFQTLQPIVSQFYRDVILPWNDVQNFPTISNETLISEKEVANKILDFINLIDRL